MVGESNPQSQTPNPVQNGPARPKWSVEYFRVLLSNTSKTQNTHYSRYSISIEYKYWVALVGRRLDGS